MDEFGVLVESIGFKSQSQSAPLSHLKNNHKKPPTTNNKNSSSSSSNPSSFDVEDLDFFFKPSSNPNGNKNVYDYDDDVFGVGNLSNKNIGGNGLGSNFEDVFGVGDLGNNNSSTSKNMSGNGLESSVVDDVFGLGNPSNNDFLSPKSNGNGLGSNVDDVFGGVGNLSHQNYSSDKNGLGANVGGDVFGGVGKRSHSVDDLFGVDRKVERRNSVDDLFGDFVGVGVKSNGAKRSVGTDELLPGFGSNATINGRKSETTFSQQSGHSAKPVSSLAEDPFEFLGGGQTRTGPESRTSEIGNYFDSIFTPGAQSSSRPSWNSSAEDFVFDTLFQSTKVSEPGHNASVKSKSTVNVPPVTNSTDDYSFLFGLGEAAPLSGQFQEVDGESGERRTSRLNHHLRTQERMAKVLKEKNQRDQQAQREQEERDRIADTLDNDIKRWAAGKEGNLRALLSSLQHVLWSDSGWVAVSLTDLITSTSVKKVYHKATLCVHPDKVQQKGANVQQKYIASKVFDLLQEAYNKFNAEELKKQ